MLPAGVRLRLQRRLNQLRRPENAITSIYLKDRGCWGKRGAFNWYPPLIVSHATHGILLAFTSLNRDLGTELCALSAKFCRRNAESTKPVVPKPVINQLGNLEQELTLQTHALDYFINETEIVSQVEI